MGSVQAKEANRQSIEAPLNLNAVGAHVAKVHVDGLIRTKEDIVMSCIKRIFEVQHFEDLVLKAQDVRANLQEMGCFSDVDVHIDTCTEAGPTSYEVTFEVKELRRISGNITTVVGNQEGSLMTGVNMPNLLGRGERFHADYTYGTKKTSAFNVGLVKPLHGRLGRGSAVSTSVFQQSAEFPPSGYKDVNRGCNFELSFSSAPRVNHSLQWEGVWRNLQSLNRTTAFAVREHAGHTLKSAVRHVLTVDRRDAPIFPEEGTLFRLSQEFAGLGGDVGFFKNEIELQTNVSLLEDIVLQGTFNCGLLKQLDHQRDKTVTIADKFFLGGPMNMRGFEMRGVGYSSDGNSMGGTAYWATGLHLYAPLPFRPGRGGFGDLFRTHFFVNCGNIGDFEINLAENARRNFEEATQNLRLSYGLGLAFKLGNVARIELNYCIPVKSQRGDRPAPGLQLGVGVNFL